nr:Chain A, Competence-stimulating peptide type 1 [Streptococcus pneumoniae]
EMRLSKFFRDAILQRKK